ncbi:MAG TPA: SGNH/GDSL hydrolase family protein [Planctomycetaceae bacterium]|nr:SGNH/GDSL hydrolase family protein [Planctomycetaceae bacterium]
MRPNALFWILALMILASPLAAAQKAPNPVYAPIEDDPNLPRVLLIGDSISEGYTLPVRKMLAGKANVHRIPVNGGDTARGLEQIDKWLGDKPWDVIHFNWGLHDVKREKDGKFDVKQPTRRTPEEYAKNLDKLVRRLKKTDAVLIWAATTPVPDGAAGRIKGDEVALNREAAKIMKRHGVKVNDLYGYVLPQLKKAQRPRNVHFTDKGSEILAKKVVEEITAALGRAKSEKDE